MKMTNFESISGTRGCWDLPWPLPTLAKQISILPVLLVSSPSLFIVLTNKTFQINFWINQSETKSLPLKLETAIFYSCTIYIYWTIVFLWLQRFGRNNVLVIFAKLAMMTRIFYKNIHCIKMLLHINVCFANLIMISNQSV